MLPLKGTRSSAAIVIRQTTKPRIASKRRTIKKGLSYTFILALQATSFLLKLPKKYFDYANVFSKKKANSLLSNSAKQYAIDFVKGQTPLYKLIYSLSKKELKVLQEYINSSLRRDKSSKALVLLKLLFYLSLRRIKASVSALTIVD
jgi:hypothetical protein